MLHVFAGQRQVRVGMPSLSAEHSLPHAADASDWCSTTKPETVWSHVGDSWETRQGGIDHEQSEKHVVRAHLILGRIISTKMMNIARRSDVQLCV